jgi:cytochrome c556
MRTALTIALTLGLAATAALAHTDVKARMDAMKTMAGDLKTLGQMAKGVVAFDETAANAALASLQAETDRIPMLLAPQASDPELEAK